MLDKCRREQWQVGDLDWNGTPREMSESDEIAIDFHMVGHYATDEYIQKQLARPKAPLRRRLQAAWALANLLYHGRPFFKAVFFEGCSQSVAMRRSAGGDRQPALRLKCNNLRR